MANCNSELPETLVNEYVLEGMGFREIYLLISIFHFLRNFTILSILTIFLDIHL